MTAKVIFSLVSIYFLPKVKECLRSTGFPLGELNNSRESKKHVGLYEVILELSSGLFLDRNIIQNSK